MKTALITGAARGIGTACTRALAKEGYAVAIGYRQSEVSAAALAKEIREAGGIAGLYLLDVTNTCSINAATEAILADFGHIDLLVNNAGIATSGLLTETTDIEWERIIDTDLSGVFRCCRAVLPGMIRRQSGCIVNISSIWGMTGAACEAAYSAAKAGVIGLTRALAKEVGPSGIRVNCVAPGVIDTEMNAHLSPVEMAALTGETPLGRIGRPEEVAAAVCFLAGTGGEFLTGQVISPNGGLVI
ncbi:MAG: elongation factor P 5-aminopentanone reductase [Candidatus Howiella sp.]|jgi:3-oxoacyl-[acyl-carrier protein] reductase